MQMRGPSSLKITYEGYETSYKPAKPMHPHIGDQTFSMTRPQSAILLQFVASSPSVLVIVRDQTRVTWLGSHGAPVTVCRQPVIVPRTDYSLYACISMLLKIKNTKDLFDLHKACSIYHVLYCHIRVTMRKKDYKKA